MKKIAVCGKGGSGKSVTVALLANGMLHRRLRVLVVDSDESNTGLYRLLGFDRAPEPLLDMMGGKQSVEDRLTALLNAGESEMTIQLMKDEIAVPQIPKEYILEQNGLKMVMVGKILMALEGCACPMGIISRSFLKKLQLDSDEVALVDLEAGVEHFGRGVETGVDAVLAVVEPSLDSIEVAERVYQLSANLNIGDVWAILNKIPSDDVAAKLKKRLEGQGMPVIGALRHDPVVFEECLEGQKVQGSGVAQDVEEVLDSIFP